MKKTVVLILFIGSIFYSFAQNPVLVGVWEKFDKYVLPDETIFINSKELRNEKDDDGNGFIDDINGIGFNEEEELTRELFYTSFEKKEDYDHGTMVGHLITQHNPNVKIMGVGFTPTTKRLKATYLNLSIEERLKNSPKEYKKMNGFVNTSLDYFAKQDAQVVNISWGLSLPYFAELNTNFGVTKRARKKQAKVWLEQFKFTLEEAFKKHPSIMFVIACGNDGKRIKRVFDVPGTIQLPNVIVVGAADEKGKRWEYSNYGKGVIYAPGVNIPYKKALKMHERGSGTSLAAPYVTACVAKKIAAGKSFTTIKNELKNSLQTCLK